jgi:hypothetical protein
MSKDSNSIFDLNKVTLKYGKPKNITFAFGVACALLSLSMVSGHNDLNQSSLELSNLSSLQPADNESDPFLKTTSINPFENNQLKNNPYAEKALNSVVLINGFNPETGVGIFTGSGTLVDIGNGQPPVILTVRHITEQAKYRPVEYVISSSRGELIGVVKPYISSRPIAKKYIHRDYPTLLVFDPSSYPINEKFLKTNPGLPISKTIPPDMIDGITSGPVGVSPGASGMAWFANDGGICGVISAGKPTEDSTFLLTDDINTNYYATRTFGPKAYMTMPSSSQTYISSLAEGTVLEDLEDLSNGLINLPSHYQTAGLDRGFGVGFPMGVPVYFSGNIKFTTSHMLANDRMDENDVNQESQELETTAKTPSVPGDGMKVVLQSMASGVSLKIP